MKKILLLAGFVFLSACAGKVEQKGKLRVGLVFDVGGRGDKSFNDSAYRGLEEAKKKLGIYYEFIEPGSGSDRESALRMLASGNFNLIFGIGFMFTDDMNHVAREFPKKHFACIDYSIIPGVKIPKNLSAIKFKEEEGSALVGAIAGLMTKTNIIGFVGGMDIPLIHKFEAGYRFGAHYMNPKCRIFTSYAGITGEAFKNPSKGYELAVSQYQRGADIIYHAAGSTGLGVFEAARKFDKLAIGVDSDQFEDGFDKKTGKAHVITSMVKRVDNAVFQTIKDDLNGKFHSGLVELGLRENGVGYVYNDRNKKLIPPDVIKKVEALKRQIISGKIKVPQK